MQNVLTWPLNKVDIHLFPVGILFARIPFCMFHSIFRKVIGIFRDFLDVELNIRFG